MELQKKALKQINDKIDKSSAAQATYTFGVLFDKDRLASGEATEIVETLTKEKWDKQTDELVALYAEIGRRRQAEKVIEVEPENNGGSNQ